MNFIILLFLLLSADVFAQEKICSGVIIEGDEIELDDPEKLLVCGDPKSTAYKIIPPYQASYFLTGFLQSRGYLRPSFQTINGVLHVLTGKISKLKVINVQSERIEEDAKTIKKEIERRYLKAPLTPSLVNSLESESIELLSQKGYPCSEVKSIVDAKTDEVNLDFVKTNSFSFGNIDADSINGLEETALDRYYPFETHDPFNQRLLDLTEKRMLRAEVVQVTYFLKNCSEDGEDFGLSQKFIPGPPRTVRYGVGASTELGPMVRAKWSNNRSGSMASTISARAQASIRSQSLTLMTDTFFWKHRPRRSVVSQLELLRESQIDFEQLLIRLSPSSIKWTRDHGDHLWSWILGPSLESGTYHSRENSNTRTFNTGVIEGSLHWMAHKYELFDTHPQNGEKFNFNFSFRHPTLGFSDPSLRLDSHYVKLSRLTEMGRGKLIGGVRLDVGTLWISNDLSAKSLPPNVKFYGGGSDDIRGFLLNTLPRNDGLGAITRLSLKLELRKTYLFKESIEGFTFIDSAYFGDESFSTRKELFYSPGFGIRWFSPIGMVQSYIARALVLNPGDDDGNLYYLGLGGTF
jgi:translocation and assembly module TamA